MKDHVYVIHFTGEAVPHYVYAKTEDDAIRIATGKKRESKILGKIPAKNYMKFEKTYQELFRKKVQK